MMLTEWGHDGGQAGHAPPTTMTTLKYRFR